MSELKQSYLSNDPRSEIENLKIKIFRLEAENATLRKLPDPAVVRQEALLEAAELAAHRRRTWIKKAALQGGSARPDETAATKGRMGECDLLMNEILRLSRQAKDSFLENRRNQYIDISKPYELRNGLKAFVTHVDYDQETYCFYGSFQRDDGTQALGPILVERKLRHYR